MWWGIPPSGADIALLYCSRGVSYTPLLLYRSPRLPWGFWFAFCAGSPAFFLLEPPPPRTDVACPSSFRLSACCHWPCSGLSGEVSAFRRRQARCSSIPGALWWGCCYFCVLVSTSLSSTWCGLGNGAILWHPPPVLPLSSARFRGLSRRSSCLTSTILSVSLLLLSAPLTSPPPMVHSRAPAVAASNASSGVVCLVISQCSARVYGPPPPCPRL